MNKVYAAITVATIFLVVLQAARFVELPTELTYSIFVLSPFIMITMVWVTLKHGEPSKYNFDERFYDDYDYKRNGIE